jgi:hypothetical protein
MNLTLNACKCFRTSAILLNGTRNELGRINEKEVVSSGELSCLIKAIWGAITSRMSLPQDTVNEYVSSAAVDEIEPQQLSHIKTYRLDCIA